MKLRTDTFRLRSSSFWAKIGITLLALILIGVRMVFPEVQIDAITLGLLVIAILPWLSSVVKSAEFPGGWKIEFRDLQQAAERVTAGRTMPVSPPSTPYLQVAATDPNLALVGLRIEIEKRVREIATRWAIPKDQPLTKLLKDLDKSGALDPSVIGGLNDLIIAGNRAAHGAEVDSRAISFALEYGPRVLSALDEELNE